MFIKNIAAFHSQPSGRRMQKQRAKKENEGMFVLNKQRKEKFVYTKI